MGRRKTKRVGEVSIRRVGVHVEFALRLPDELIQPLKQSDFDMTVGRWLGMAANRLEMNPDDRLAWEILDDPDRGLTVDFGSLETESHA